MKEKIRSFFDSLWFNAIMSIVAVVEIVENAVNQSYIRVVIWLVLAYHFIKLTKDGMSKK